MVDGRKKFPSLQKGKKAKRYWFHCASLGEFEQAKPVMEKLQWEGCEIVVSFFSPSGYELRKNFSCEGVFYLPWDKKTLAEKWIHEIKPDVFILVKYEFWYQFIKACILYQIPIYVISTTFRKNHFVFSLFGKPWLKLFSHISHFFVQNDSSLKLLIQKGISQATLSGDTRYDRVWQSQEQPISLEWIANFKSSNKLLVLGSSWQEEEQILFNVLQFNLLSNQWKIIIAPHQISKKNISDLINKFSHWNPIPYSQLIATQNLEYSNQSRILIIDNIGMLAQLYQYGNLAIVGGGFGRGLHNILEPLAFGTPVVFGEKTNKYPEANEAISHQVGFSLTNATQLSSIINTLFTSEDDEQVLRLRCKDFIHQRIGATQIIINALKKA